MTDNKKHFNHSIFVTLRIRKFDNIVRSFVIHMQQVLVTKFFKKILQNLRSRKNSISVLLLTTKSLRIFFIGESRVMAVGQTTLDLNSV